MKLPELIGSGPLELFMQNAIIVSHIARRYRASARPYLFQLARVFISRRRDSSPVLLFSAFGAALTQVRRSIRQLAASL